MTADTITVVRARGRRLAKLALPDGTMCGYDNAFRHDLYTVALPDLTALATLLQRLLTRPECAVVRGVVLDLARTRGVRRLVHPDAKTGDLPTLREHPRRWLALDLDGLPLPPGTDRRDIVACGEAARAALPAAFCDVQAVAVASASHGIKPGLRLRWWCWCDRPVSGPELMRWFRGVAVDPAVFRPAQLIYTAAPLFAGGAADPLPKRLALLPGAEPVVRVPSPAALAPPPRPALAPLPADAVGGSRYALAALTNATCRVATAPVNARHYSIVAEARGLARFVAARLLTEGEVRRALSGAAELAGKTSDEADAVVTWALAHPSDAALPKRCQQ